MEQDPPEALARTAAILGQGQQVNSVCVRCWRPEARVNQIISRIKAPTVKPPHLPVSSLGGDPGCATPMSVAGKAIIPKHYITPLFALLKWRRVPAPTGTAREKPEALWPLACFQSSSLPWKHHLGGQGLPLSAFVYHWLARDGAPRLVEGLQPLMTHRTNEI